MKTRALFIHSIDKFEFNQTTGQLTMNCWATEINNSNKAQAFAEVGALPYSLATLLPVQKYENYNEKVDYFYIMEGKSNDPIMFSINTNNTALTFGKGWFDDKSPVSYKEIVEIMQQARLKGAQVLGDVINFLSFGG